jgi:flagellar hook protein FlgE
MSLFSAINTAISGLTAQSSAFGNISQDVANSQTTGFKRVDTTFIDYLTTSTPTQNAPGAVVARPAYVNNVQGSITQTDNPLGLAIAGQGFFAVSQATGQVNNVPTFNPQQFYTRAGDFSMNANGYLVNGAGQYLNGWSVDPVTNIVDQNGLAPIHVSQSTYNPVKTTAVTLSANLPATPTPGTAVQALPGVPAVPAGVDASGNPTAAVPAIPAVVGSPLSSQITVYDALGTSHSVTLNWTQTPDPANRGAGLQNDWTVQVTVPNPAGASSPPLVLETANVKFGQVISGNPVAEGTIGQVTPLAPVAGPGGYSAGLAATLDFSHDFGSGSQSITGNLGTYGGTTGVTQYAGSSYSLLGLTQNGVPPGSFSGVTTQPNGDVVVNYNNGQTRTIAQIPVITFNAPNALQGQDGQAFTATQASGTPLAEAASTNGAGNLVTGSIESSNVDIASEFSHLIVAQQAYSSNAKVVTTANTMLQVTLQMVT